MKIAVIDTYYPKFLEMLSKQEPDINHMTYDSYNQLLLNQFFGTSDFYSKHLNALGVESIDIIANSVISAKLWANENNYRISNGLFKVSPKVSRLPIIGSFMSKFPALVNIAIQQIRSFKPDVLYCQDVGFFHPNILSELKKDVRLIVGQIASKPPAYSYLRSFDLMVTSFPHFVSRFRQSGLQSEYLKLAFDPRVLDQLCFVNEKDIQTSFVGGISKQHTKGTELLELLAKNSNIQFFGYGSSNLSNDSAIINNHHGEVWGIEMFEILSRSLVTINRHINASENYANNMRLYEATGVGSMLLTDNKTNLNEIFEVGNEISVYNSPYEAIEMIHYYENNLEEAKQIAYAGQKRTLTEHTYEKRMAELLDIIKKYI